MNISKLGGRGWISIKYYKRLSAKSGRMKLIRLKRDELRTSFGGMEREMEKVTVIQELKVYAKTSKYYLELTDRAPGGP